MTILEIVELVSNHSGIATIIVVACLSLLEVSKIKINPWSSFFVWFGKAINKDVLNQLKKQQEDIKKLKDEVDGLNRRMDVETIDNIRREIFEFATSCKQKEKHTEKQFLRIIDLHQKYDSLIKARNIKNGQMDVEYAFILRLYNRLLDENAFLVLVDDDE